MEIKRNKYDKTIERIKISTNRVNFDLELRGFITVFGGVSSSGKTFFIETIHNIYLNKMQELRESYRLQGLVVLNTQNLNEGVEDREIVGMLKSRKGNLVIIDNADTILEGREKLLEYITKDTNNQYIIMSRGGIDLKLSTNHYSEMQERDGYVVNNFLTTIKGWK